MYYLLKVNSKYTGEYPNLIMITKMYGNYHNAKLSYVSVSDYEYTCDGTGCFLPDDIAGNRWQTDRNTGYPHWMIFKSETSLYEFSFLNDPSGYFPKTITLFKSNELLSYNDVKWESVLDPVDATNQYSEQSFIIDATKHLLLSDGKYYSISNENYDIDNKVYVNVIRNQELDYKSFYEKNDVRLENIYKNIEISGENFKPADKFDNFKISKFKPTI